MDAFGGARITDIGLATISDSHGAYSKERDVLAFAIVVIGVRVYDPFGPDIRLIITYFNKGVH